MNYKLFYSFILLAAILMPATASFAEQPATNISAAPITVAADAGNCYQPTMILPNNNRQRIWIGLGAGWTYGNSLDENVSYAHDSTALSFQLTANSNFGIGGEIGIRNSHFGLRLRSDMYNSTDNSFQEVTHIGGFTSTYSTNMFSYSTTDAFCQFMYFIPFATESDYYLAGGAGWVTKSFGGIDTGSSGWSNVNEIKLKALAIPISVGLDLALSKHWALNIDATYMVVPAAASAKLVNWPAGTPQNVVDSSKFQPSSYFIPFAMFKYTF